MHLMYHNQPSLQEIITCWWFLVAPFAAIEDKDIKLIQLLDYVMDIYCSDVFTTVQ